MPSKFDAMVALFDQDDGNLTYQIILALTDKKPALCLFPEKSAPPKLLPTHRQNILKYLIIKPYTSGDISSIITSFFRQQGDGDMERFNFFMTADIADYINWVPFSKKQTKSDFIRQLIREKMNKDKEYRKHVKTQPPIPDSR